MKLVKYLYYLLLAVSAVLFIVYYAQGSEDAMKAMAPVVLIWGVVLLVIALASMLVLPLLFKSGKKIQKSSLIAYGIFVLVIVVAVLFSSDAALDGITTSEPYTPLEMKFTDGGVMAAGLLIAVSFIAIIGGGLKNMFSK